MSPRAQPFKLPPVGAWCQEAGPSSREMYIPCKQPALRVVKQKTGETYCMCLGCSDHNVKNRGATYVLDGEDYALSLPLEYAEAMRIANRHVNDPDPAKRRGANAALPDEMIDVEEDPDRANAVSDSSRKEVADVAKEMIDLEAFILKKEAELKDLKERLRLMKEAEMPPKMKMIGMKEIPLLNGDKVQLKDVLSVSCKEDHRELMYNWLEEPEVGAESIVKRTVVISFGRDDQAWFKKFVRDMEQRKKPLDYYVSRKVEPSTLKKWVTERKDQGKDYNTFIEVRDEAGNPVRGDDGQVLQVPLITVYEATIAEIVHPKKGRKVDGM